MTDQASPRRPATAGRDNGRRSKAAPSLATRDRILAAAERLFAEEGYDGASMPAIAKASDITAGAIYRHFDGKEALFFEVLARVVRASPLTTGSTSATVPDIAAAYTTRPLKLLRQLAVEVHYASRKHSKVRRLLRQSLDGNIRDLREAILAAQQTGSRATAVDPQFPASAALVFVMGLMHMDTLLPQLVDDRAWFDFVRQCVEALLRMRSGEPKE